MVDHTRWQPNLQRGHSAASAAPSAHVISDLPLPATTTTRTAATPGSRASLKRLGGIEAPQSPESGRVGQGAVANPP